MGMRTKEVKSSLWRSRFISERLPSFAIYTVFLFLAIALLPHTEINPEAKVMIASIGLLVTWRYSWGFLNFFRSLQYRKKMFPRIRSRIEGREDALMPSEIYILMTVYRINAGITARTFWALVHEAGRCKVPVTIIASIVEKQDEFLFRTIWENCRLPENITLKIVRAPGKGKRYGLVTGLRAISRCLPAPDAVTVLMDGDTVMLPDALRKSLPVFSIYPRLSALTTDEICEFKGSKIMKEWYNMGFAQRHILMSSLSLSRRVMTLTGGMSAFRTSIVTQPAFIDYIGSDGFDHWRPGRFRFLTGDDKSSLYWLMKQGYEQLYVPDVQILTIEEPTEDGFIVSSTKLMQRRFGNMLRTNTRILKLGLRRIPFFVWWAFVDQRISMWTALAGPIFAVMLSLKFGFVYLLYYLCWIGFGRWIMSLMLLSARKELSWRYPFLLYYSQVYGALVKTWVLFRLDRQTWTRQKTVLERNMNISERLWNRWSSHLTHASAIIILICVIGFSTDVLVFPEAAARMMSGYNEWLR